MTEVGPDEDNGFHLKTILEIRNPESLRELILQFILPNANHDYILSYLKSTSVGGACTQQWDVNSIAFKCRDCESDNTCAMCVECFFKSNHQGHSYQLIRTTGGCCDCGDLSSWAAEGCCKDHAGLDEVAYRSAATAQIDWLDSHSPGAKRRAVKCFGLLSSYFWEWTMAFVHKRAIELPSEWFRSADVFRKESTASKEIYCLGVDFLIKCLLDLVPRAFAFRMLVEEAFFPNERMSDVIVIHRDLPTAIQKSIQQLYLTLVSFPVFKKRFGVSMGRNFLIMYSRDHRSIASRAALADPYTLSNKGLGALSVQVFTVTEVSVELIETGVLSSLLREIIDGHLYVISEEDERNGFLVIFSVALRYILRSIGSDDQNLFINDIGNYSSTIVAFFAQFFGANRQRREQIEHIAYENKCHVELFMVTSNFHKGLVKFYDALKSPLKTPRFLTKTAPPANTYFDESKLGPLLKICGDCLASISGKDVISADMIGTVSFHLDSLRLMCQLVHVESVLESFTGALCFPSVAQDVRQYPIVEVASAVQRTKMILDVFSLPRIAQAIWPVTHLLSTCIDIRDGFWVRNGRAMTLQLTQYAQVPFALRIDLLTLLLSLLAVKIHEVGCTAQMSQAWWSNAKPQNSLHVRLLMHLVFGACCTHWPQIDFRDAPRESEVEHSVEFCSDDNLFAWHRSLLSVSFNPDKQNVIDLGLAENHVLTNSPILRLVTFWMIIASVSGVAIREVELATISREALSVAGMPVNESPYAKRTSAVAALELIRVLALSGRASYSAIESKIAKEWRHNPLLPSLLKELAVRDIGATGAVTFLLKKNLWSLVDLCTLDCSSTDLTEVEDRAIEAGCFDEDVALIGPCWTEAKRFIQTTSGLSGDEESPLITKWLFVARLLAGDGTLLRMIQDTIEMCVVDKVIPDGIENGKELEQFVLTCRDRIIVYSLKVLNDLIMPLWYEGSYKSEYLPTNGDPSLWSLVESPIHQMARDGVVLHLLKTLTSVKQTGHLEGYTLKVLSVVSARLSQLAQRKNWLLSTDQSAKLSTQQDALAQSPIPPDSTARRKQQDTLMAEYALKQANFLENFVDEDDDDADMTPSREGDLSTNEAITKSETVLSSETLERLNAFATTKERLDIALKKVPLSLDIAATLELSNLNDRQCAICHEGQSEHDFLAMLAFSSDSNMIRRFNETPCWAPAEVKGGDHHLVGLSGSGSPLNIPSAVPTLMACGHMAHLSCISKHCRDVRRNRYRTLPVVRVEDGEFCCPFCRSVVNRIVPYLPLMSLFKKGEQLTPPSPSLFKELSQAFEWTPSHSARRSTTLNAELNAWNVTRVFQWSNRDSEYRTLLKRPRGDSTALKGRILNQEGDMPNLLIETDGPLAKKPRLLISHSPLIVRTQNGVPFFFHNALAQTFGIGHDAATTNAFYDNDDGLFVEGDDDDGLQPFLLDNDGEVARGANVMAMLRAAVETAVGALPQPLPGQGDATGPVAYRLRLRLEDGGEQDINFIVTRETRQVGDQAETAAVEAEQPLAQVNETIDPVATVLEVDRQEFLQVENHDDEHNGLPEDDVPAGTYMPEETGDDLGVEDNGIVFVNEGDVDENGQAIDVPPENRNPYWLSEEEEAEEMTGGDAESLADLDIQSFLFRDVAAPDGGIMETATETVQTQEPPTVDAETQPAIVPLDAPPALDTTFINETAEIDAPLWPSAIVSNLLKLHKSWVCRLDVASQVRLLLATKELGKAKALKVMTAGESPLFWCLYFELLRTARYKQLTILHSLASDAPRPLFVSLLRAAVLVHPVDRKSLDMNVKSADFWTASDGMSVNPVTGSIWFADHKRIFLHLFLTKVSGLKREEVSGDGDGDEGRDGDGDEGKDGDGRFCLIQGLTTAREELRSLIRAQGKMVAVSTLHDLVRQEMKSLVALYRASVPALRRRHELLSDFLHVFRADDKRVSVVHHNAVLQTFAARLDWLGWEDLCGVEVEEKLDEEFDEIVAAHLLAYQRALRHVGRNRVRNQYNWTLTETDLQAIISTAKSTEIIRDILSSEVWHDIARFERSSGVDKFRRWFAWSTKTGNGKNKKLSDFDAELCASEGGSLWLRISTHLPHIPLLSDLMPRHIQFEPAKTLSQLPTFHEYLHCLRRALKDACSSSAMSLISTDKLDHFWDEHHWSRRLDKIHHPLICAALVDFLQFAFFTISCIWRLDTPSSNKVAYPSEAAVEHAMSLWSSISADEPFPQLGSSSSDPFVDLNELISVFWSRVMLDSSATEALISYQSSPFSLEDGWLASDSMKPPAPSSRLNPVEVFGIGESLPHAFFDLVAKQYKRKCPKCDLSPGGHAICLTCDSMTCLKEMEVDSLGETSRHAAVCGNGSGIFMLPFVSLLLYVSGKRCNFAPSPYLDENGEADHALERGKETFLSTEKLHAAANTLINSDVARELVRICERHGRYVRRSV